MQVGLGFSPAPRQPVRASSSDAGSSQEERSRYITQYCDVPPSPRVGVARSHSGQFEERLARIEAFMSEHGPSARQRPGAQVLEEKRSDASLHASSSMLNEHLDNLLERFERKQAKALGDHLTGVVERMERSAKELDFSVKKAVELMLPTDDHAEGEQFQVRATATPPPVVTDPAHPPPVMGSHPGAPAASSPQRSVENHSDDGRLAPTSSWERKERLKNIMALGGQGSADGLASSAALASSIEVAPTTHKEHLADTLQVDLWGERMKQLAGSPAERGEGHVGWARWLCRMRISFPTFLKFTSGLLVMLNAVYMGIQGHMKMINAIENREDEGWMDVVDLTFTVLIALELVLAAGTQRIEFVIGEDRWWNLFDVAMVLSSIFEAMFQFLDLSFCRILRPLRMLRLLRVLRLFRSLTTLRLIAAMVGSSILSVGWCLLFLLTFAYMVSIFIMQALTTHIRKNDVAGDDWLGEVKTFYGDLPTSLYYLLASISGGVDWSDVASPLERLGWIYQFAFLMFIMFTLFGLFNILTGVFVESAKNVARVDEELVIQEELKTQQSFLNQLRGILREGLQDGSNTMTEQCLKEHLENPQVQAHLKFLGVETSDAMSVHKLLRSGDDTVDVDAFVMALLRLHGSAKAVDMITMIYDNKKVAEMNNLKLNYLTRHLHGLHHMIAAQGEAVKLLAHNVEDLHGRFAVEQMHRAQSTEPTRAPRPRVPPQLPQPNRGT